MEQPPGYVTQRENKVCRFKKAIYGLKQIPRACFEKFNITIFGCHSDHSVFIRHTNFGIVVLAIYVDNILLTDSDLVGLLETKEYLKHHFVIKNMGRPKYLLKIKVAHPKYSVLLSQQKYDMDLLEETRLLGCKPANILMEANVDL